jgi:hypothetical protein
MPRIEAPRIFYTAHLVIAGWQAHRRRGARRPRAHARCLRRRAARTIPRYRSRIYYAATVSAASILRGSSVSRAITRRWICEVPSYSCMIFASRNSFSTG